MTHMDVSQSSDDSNSELMDPPEDPLTTKLHVFENTACGLHNNIAIKIGAV